MLLKNIGNLKFLKAIYLKCATELKKNNWQTQKDNGVDYICSNDFSFYDQVLDTICLVGSIPERYKHKDDKSFF
jgi:5-methyltetrahydropteroyltriglutamate--homocysteine methyltransferase